MCPIKSPLLCACFAAIVGYSICLADPTIEQVLTQQEIKTLADKYRTLDKDSWHRYCVDFYKEKMDQIAQEGAIAVIACQLWRHHIYFKEFDEALRLMQGVVRNANADESTRLQTSVIFWLYGKEILEMRIWRG